MVAFVEEYTFHFLYVHLCYFWEVLDHNAFSGLVAQMCQWSLNFQLLACCSYIDSYIGHLSAFFFLLFFCAANMQILAYRLFNAQQFFIHECVWQTHPPWWKCRTTSGRPNIIWSMKETSALYWKTNCVSSSRKNRSCTGINHIHSTHKSLEFFFSIENYMYP